MNVLWIWLVEFCLESGGLSVYVFNVWSYQLWMVDEVHGVLCPSMVVA